MTVSQIGPREVRGNGDAITLWGLLLGRHPASAPEQLKFVWKVTGHGSVRLRAINPAGIDVPLVAGPDPHEGSNYRRPGDEYGAIYNLNRAGCWDLRVLRGADTADVLMRVHS